MTAWEELAALGEVAAELAADGRLDELALIDNERRAITALLKGSPPPEARAALVRALEAEARVQAALASGRAATRARLAVQPRRAVAIRAYATR